MVGKIRFWNSDKQFGFLEATDKREFYFRGDRFTRQDYCEGMRVRFDVAKIENSWTQRLNEGTLRDVATNHRNPRPPRRPDVKPVAENVAVLEESSS
jgi:cold shock CspA family protein